MSRLQAIFSNVGYDKLLNLNVTWIHSPQYLFDDGVVGIVFRSNLANGVAMLGEVEVGYTVDVDLKVDRWVQAPVVLKAGDLEGFFAHSGATWVPSE